MSSSAAIFVIDYLDETRRIAGALNLSMIQRIADALVTVRARCGRVAFLGVGGSAANASHAVNDFRKIAHMDAMTPSDNVAEITARTNDDGWDRTFVDWLTCSRFGPHDAVFVLSVGGGSSTASPNLFHALTYAQSAGCAILGIVGSKGGDAAVLAHHCLVLPTPNTAQVESFQSIILHLLVNHPALHHD